MACTTPELVAASLCVAQGMSDHQLLAYIAFQLATDAGASTDPADMVAASKCVAQGLSDRQLLAVIATLACESA